MYYLFLIYFRAWLPGSCSPRLALEGHWQNTHRQLDTNQWNNEKKRLHPFLQDLLYKTILCMDSFIRKKTSLLLLITCHTSIWAPSTTGQHAYCIVLCSYCDDLNFQVQNYKVEFNKLYCYLYDLSMSSVFQKKKTNLARLPYQILNSTSHCTSVLRI